MKFRIREHKIANPSGNKFFIETGLDYKEKYWAFIYTKKTKWTEIAEFTTFDEAIENVLEIKNSQPTFHEIK